MIIIMMSALYLTNNLSCISELTKQSTDIYMSFQSDTFVSDSGPTNLCGYICCSNRTHLFLILNQLLCSCSLLLSVTGEATHNTSMAICLTRPRLNPTSYRYHVHQYTTYNVSETCNRCNDDKT